MNFDIECQHLNLETNERRKKKPGEYERTKIELNEYFLMANSNKFVERIMT